MSGQKLNIGLLAIIIIVSSSCQSLRIKGSRTGTEIREINAGRFISEMKSKNITGQPIAINRITINYENDYEKRRIRANARMDGKGALLVSIRTFAGIEAVRIIIRKDTVKVADRINRICYVGQTKELENKYGIKYNFINLLFGDFEEIDPVKRRLKCEGGRIIIDDYRNGLEYTINCDIYKLVEAVGKYEGGKDEIRGSFSEFREENGLLYPGKIRWDLGVNNTTIEIEMQNIRRDENAELIFRVGDSYKVKRLR